MCPRVLSRMRASFRGRGVVTDKQLAQKFIDLAQLCCEMECQLAEKDDFDFSDRVRTMWRDAEVIKRKFRIDPNRAAWIRVKS